MDTVPEKRGWLIDSVRKVLTSKNSDNQGEKP
jgi:hypothetical protein